MTKPKIQNKSKAQIPNGKISVLIFVILILDLFCHLNFGICHLSFSWAQLDIFDHRPKEIERERRAAKKQNEMNFLDYPKECFLKGDYKEVVRVCQSLLDYSPAKRSKAELSYLIGLSLLKLNRFIEARSYFNDVILIEKKNEDLKRHSLVGIGDSYLLEGSLDKARQRYEQILTDYPDSPTTCIVYYRLAETLGRLGQSNEAKYYLDKLQQEFPFSFEARMASENIEESTAVLQNYSVQIGCFSNKGNAEALCKKLLKEGFESRIYETQETAGPMFRVKVGNSSSKEEIEALEKRLKAAGYSTKICP